MDEPLFGEQKKQTQVFQYVVGFVVLGFTTFSIVSGVVKGLKDAKIFALVFSNLLTLACLSLLVHWWRDKDDRLHPKFKWLLSLLVLAVIMSGIATDTIVWTPVPVVKCPVCAGGLMDLNSGQCISVSNLQNCFNTGWCLMVHSPTFGYCYSNCTTNSLFLGEDYESFG
eukprot:TRINITY_DN330_c0_g1_i1.p1 TRINITY_DN330_c0_g1~~TRINITY_DN330_c0_g1_i1.p1  ORF type:complete len:169 (-),score=26.95 TRINITY_DN330_c0_g1_i1:178-684(-)